MNESNNDRQHPSPYESSLVRSRLLLYLKGLAMGLGDSVPGVSGGTIAVITNIYDRLIYSIRAVDLAACKLLIAGRFTEFWLHINGNFLLILVLGIFSGLLVSANTALFLLQNYFEPLMAFFIGLVLASIWLLKDNFKFRHWQNLVALLAGISVASWVGTIDPANATMSYAYVFVSGAVAICAMILPGLSGAFVLLLLGVYEFILRALIEFNIPYILVFVSGCVIGLLAFSRVLAWLLGSYHQLSYGFITGMLLGSLTVLWPWQQTQSYYTDRAGELHALHAVNVWPLNYTELTGGDAMLIASLVAVVAGALVVILLHRFAGSNSLSRSETTG